MCGIAGFVGVGDRDDLKEMTRRLAHRGPDGEGLHHDAERGVFLGHRRLAVIDLHGGAQPMWNEDGEVGVVFNGEIYNHRALRLELERRGHRFRSDHCDTEVLVHGWEEWGADLPLRLSGMFAFAIHDRRYRRLFLARDRMGKKPLFYATGRDLVAFASEVSALLGHSQVPREVDRRALQKFFAHGFFPAPHTPFSAVRRLPGGWRLEVDLASLAVTASPYWSFAIEPEESGRGEDDLAEELRSLLVDAVGRRLDSDVPLGVLLSGGVDSSAVAAIAAGLVGGDGVQTFSIGFDEQSFDESHHAERMARHIGSHHRMEMCRAGLARNDLTGLLDRLDEPMGDSSILPTWLVSRFARSHVTVALSGDGADELFAGYDTFKALAPSRAYRRVVPPALTGLLRRLAVRLPASDANMSLDFKVQRWLRGMTYPETLWNPVWLAALDPDEIAALFGERVDVEDLYSEVIETWDASRSRDPVDRSMEFYTRFYLQDGVLVKVDRASMLEGLEIRSPFLDDAVVDFARRLPSRFKFRGGERKVLLKRALRPLVPAEILDRPKKGFGIPLARWLRDMPPPQAADVPFLDAEWLHRRWRDHSERRRDCRHGLWCWMGLSRYFGAMAGTTSQEDKA
ncbi:MAG: asparagine synthase (glutamine-hydrolyzing) [Magnetospirillum sp.]|nr:asparagine synthase (glutamine-hydrolyzing) [Magnetospirillum sp.]